MATITSPEQQQAYVEKKYVGPWKDTVGKIKTLEAEFARLRAKANVNAPAGLEGKSLQEFERIKAEYLRVWGAYGKYLAEVKFSSEEIGKRFDRFKQKGE